MSNSTFVSVVTPYDPSSSTCGYCSPLGQRSETESFHKVATLDALQLSCEAYQSMIDRGWRRSGTYCYKPDLRRSCCPQYTIKLDALKFKPSKSQRKIINRWARFVLQGEENEMARPSKSSTNFKPGESFPESIHTPEYRLAGSEAAHKFEVTLERSSYTVEKYTLYRKYQETIHHDHNNTRSGFMRFLVESPLMYEPIQYASLPQEYLPKDYGSYHQLYRLDGVLIAVGVIDILSQCVSSVYFMYDPEWEKFSLGKLSALREASLAAEIHAAGVPELTSLYMGFYIYSCPKMRYKGDYSPSYLADPETYSWFPLEKCIPQLESCRYACFSHPEHSLHAVENEIDGGEIEFPSDDILSHVLVIRSNSGNQMVPLFTSRYWRDSSRRRAILCYVHGIGPELAKRLILAF